MSDPPRNPVQPTGATLAADVANVRKRPAMYVGDTRFYGLHHLAYFLVDIAADDVRINQCSVMRFELTADGSLSFFSDARPIPRALAREALTEFRVDPGTSSDWSPLWFECLAVQALSDRCVLDAWTPEGHWRLRSAQGQLDGMPQEIRPAEPIPEGARRGFRFTLTPDRSIFESSAQFDFETLWRRFEEIAFQMPGLRVVGRGPGVPERVAVHPGGLAEWVEARAGTKAFPAHAIALERTWDQLRIRVAFQWKSGDADVELQSFANTVPTRKGGRHVIGFYSALLAAVREVPVPGGWWRHHSLKEELPLSLASIQRGLVAAVSVDGPRRHLEFLGPTKDTLGIAGLDRVIAEQLTPAIVAELRRDPDGFTPLQDRFLEWEAHLWGLRGEE